MEGARKEMKFLIRDAVVHPSPLRCLQLYPSYPFAHRVSWLTSFGSSKLAPLSFRARLLPFRAFVAVFVAVW